MVEFDTVWSDLQISLKPGGEIKNWNAYNGYLGDNLRINEVNPNYLSIDPPRVWGTQVIPRVDFEQVWNIWHDYRELRVKRDALREFTNHSKYIISIFRWYETEQNTRLRSKDLSA